VPYWFSKGHVVGVRAARRAAVRKSGTLRVPDTCRSVRERLLDTGWQRQHLDPFFRDQDGVLELR